MATDTTTQIVKESPEVEALRLGLVKSAQALTLPSLPAYQVAGFTPEQLRAMQLGVGGIGAYQPYLSTAGTQLGTAGQYFGGAEQMYRSALTGGTAGLTGAEGLMGRYTQADLGPAQQYMTSSLDEMAKTGPNFAQAVSGTQQGMGFGEQAAQEAARAIQQPGFAQATSTLGTGIAALTGAEQGFDPSRVSEFMNPYQQKVIDESLRQIGRQSQQAQMNLQAQAVRSGAFGGSREGVQRAELGRGLAEAQNAAIVGGLAQGYQSAMGQAQSAFEAQKQRQLAQAQGYQSAAQLGGALAGQQAQLGLSAAQQRALAGQMAMQGAGQLGSLETQRSQMAQNIARYRGDIGQQLAAQQLQQAGLGQAAAQGLANIANQRFAMGSQAAGGIGALGGQFAALAGQQALLGESAQRLRQGDVANLFNIGQYGQQLQQSELDALRLSKMQDIYRPYQQLAFQSDIYKGAPSSQMAFTQQFAPTPSAVQQATGLVIGGASAARAAQGVL